MKKEAAVYKILFSFSSRRPIVSAGYRTVGMDLNEFSTVSSFQQMSPLIWIFFKPLELVFYDLKYEGPLNSKRLFSG
jgi:hypothetical protein